MTWGTSSVAILVVLGFSVLDLGRMYATDIIIIIIIIIIVETWLKVKNRH